MIVRLKGFPMLVAFAAALVGLVIFLVVQFALAQQDHDAPGRLLTGARTQLGICVDSTEDLVLTDTEVGMVEAAVERVLARLPDVPKEFEQRQVERGCPAPRHLTGHRQDFDERNSLRGNASYLKAEEGEGAASAYRVHVYFAPEGSYAAGFGDEPYALAAEEIMCWGSACLSVTSGLYLTTSVEEQVLDRGLSHVLTLLSSEALDEALGGIQDSSE